jgi:hypothetical protein
MLRKNWGLVQRIGVIFSMARYGTALRIAQHDKQAERDSRDRWGDLNVELCRNSNFVSGFSRLSASRFTSKRSALALAAETIMNNAG